MRYLYGDSTPFPYELDFLATLGAFMTAATRVVQLEADAQVQAQDLSVQSQARARGIDAVAVVHQSLLATMNQVATAAPGQPEPPPAALDYVRQIKDYSARIVQQQRQQDKEKTDRDTALLHTENERRMAETKTALDTFFRVAALPILSSRVSLKLLDGSRDAKYEIGVVFRNLGDIITSFVLSTARHSAWNTPRRVLDLAPGFDLLVGAKKSFFKGVVTPEQLHLDEYVISRADIHDRGEEIAIRRKLELKDAFVFRISKTDKGVTGEVERLEDPNAKALSPTLEPQDIAKVEQLAQALRVALTDLYNDRDAVARVEIEGKDVYKNKLALALIGRLVRTFAPIVEQVTQRSPSKQELSLKLENDQGKREELYLKRSELLDKLQPLNAEGRAVFAPLGLDDWVPTLTVHPPDVQS